MITPEEIQRNLTHPLVSAPLAINNKNSYTVCRIEIFSVLFCFVFSLSSTVFASCFFFSKKKTQHVFASVTEIKKCSFLVRDIMHINAVPFHSHAYTFVNNVPQVDHLLSNSCFQLTAVFIHA